MGSTQGLARPLHPRALLQLPGKCLPVQGPAGSPGFLTMRFTSATGPVMSALPGGAWVRGGWAACSEGATRVAPAPTAAAAARNNYRGVVPPARSYCFYNLCTAM